MMMLRKFQEIRTKEIPLLLSYMKEIMEHLDFLQCNHFGN